MSGFVLSPNPSHESWLMALFGHHLTFWDLGSARIIQRTRHGLHVSQAVAIEVGLGSSLSLPSLACS
jgi:hypothetical protein